MREEAEATFAKKLEETEVTVERRRSEEVVAVETECELRRLREAEALRQGFDRERRVWLSDKEDWTAWKETIRGEKETLLLRVAELEREKSASGGHSVLVAVQQCQSQRAREVVEQGWELVRCLPEPRLLEGLPLP